MTSSNIGARPLSRATWLRRFAWLGLMGIGWATAQPTQPSTLFSIRAGDLFGLIDASGKVLLPPEFFEIKPGDPLTLVRKGSRTAYVDGTGRMVIEPQEALSQPFASGLSLAPAKDAQGRSRYGYVDATRAFVIPPTWEHAETFVDGLAVVGVADAWGVLKFGAIDRSGRLVLPATHS